MKSKMRYITTLLLLLSINVFSQDKGIGISIKSSNMGIGSDVIFQFHKRMSARVGFDHFAYNHNRSIEQSDVTYDGNARIKLGSITALYDYFILPSMYLTGGFAYNRMNINFSGEAASNYSMGELEIPAEKIGRFEFDLKPGLTISPYFGIGFGNALGPKLIGFNFEIGTYYHGRPNININASGLTSPTANPAHEQEKLMESQIDQYVLYPIVRGSISFKIAKFK
ncbi:MAG: hypothetical protein JW842_13020 [Prolixibacteraceae bacterium]|nr:hypothetical protein [Prolixibacteraceae bacterium]